MSNEQIDISTITRLHRPVSSDVLQSLREAGMKRFEQIGLPKADDEEWRFTNTDPIAEVQWKLPTGIYDAAGLLPQYTLKSVSSAELVFVNGQYRQDLSHVAALPKGIYVGLLSAAPAAIAAKAQQKLATAATIEKSSFTALNAGFLDQVIVVHAARGALIEKPVHILHLSTTNGSPLLFCPRVLILADEGANYSVVETHGGDAADPVLSNAVTEVFLDRDAVVEHFKTNWLSHSTWSINSTISTLAESSVYTNHSVSLGSKLTRNDLEVILNGSHADATLNGLVMVNESRQIDNHTLIRHEKPECTSHELYKHVVGDRAFGVFKGKIFVQKDAQKTDAKQTNRTLLLSDKAMMESMPALEIYADDVKCTHGSTTGPLDEDMLFYLRSRGLSTDAARHLLVYAFAADMTRRMKVGPIRTKIEHYIALQQNLPQDLSIEAL